jgi:transposase
VSIGLYLAAPTKAIVISVDEKPSIQALSRPTGYVVTHNQKVVRGIKSTYRRNGILNLFAALQIASGVVYTQPAKTKKRVDFLAFMDDLLRELPSAAEKEIHVIFDKYCIRKRCTQWLAEHPHVQFHFTPTSASWLNQVEIWFGIFTGKVLRGTSFDSTEQLSIAIEKYVNAYNSVAKPFVWRKRDVKGSQLRDTIANLCN